MKKLPVLHWFVFALLFFTATAAGQSSPVNGSVAEDDHSFAQPDKAFVTHLNLSIKVNFATHQLTCKAVWTIHNITKGDEIIFDDNGLNIQRITIGYPEKNTRWFLDTATTFMGRALHIKILPTTKKVTVYYTTSKDAVALQWLTPQQTTDKTKPYLFTQSYAIWARTWLPCQDMPGIRFTYTATVAVPRDLVAAMSAEGPITKTTNSIYHFKQAHPIPSYLMALAVGDIKFKAIDNRTGVYAEPTLLNKAAREFTDMGKMVTTAEALYGPYRWGRFDVLIAPPSFTLSGMENPNLVFLTPGLITGDRSLVSVVAHELAHSWSGNLVTNATWNDFWLNEGITTYFEHRIGEELYGHDEADMQAVLSRKSLRNDVAELGDSSSDTHLKLNLSNRNPDEALTAIPYDKGYAFLQVIEQIAGRKKFDEFLKSYFSAHAFQSHTTEQFLAALNQQLFNNDTAVENNIRENEWVYGGGIPANIIPVSSAKFMRIDSLLALTDLRKALPGLSQKIVSFNERYYFLGHLPAIVLPGDMAALDKEFSFTQSQNYRLLRLWLLLSIAHHYAPADSQLESYMTKYGASSYSLYAALIATSKGKVKAKQIFAKARSGYHPIEAKAIEELLK